jgi:hypothetical protein
MEIYFSSLNEFVRESAPFTPILLLLFDLKKNKVKINKKDEENERAIK